MSDEEMFEDASEELDEDEDIERSFSPLGRNAPPPDAVDRTADKPLANKNAIPLFPGSDRKQQRVGTGIKVYKLDPPGVGYKGRVHTGATEDFIAQQWGDGSYNLDIVNGKDVVLQTREAVKIAVGYTPPRETESHAPVSNGLDPTEALRLTAISHAQERQRSARDNAALNLRTAEMAREHTKLVTETMRETRERDREFHETGTKRTESFFMSILEQNRIGHDQMMARMREEHRQSMEAQQMRHEQMLTMMTHTHEREMQSNNPNTMLSLFREGMTFAQENSSGDNEEGWVKAVQSGVTGLRELRLAAEASRDIHRGPRKQLPPASGESPKSKVKREISDETRDILAFRRDCAKRGIDFRAALVQARKAVGTSDDSGENGMGQENP